jgi:SAM-dependent methyltransferase
MDYRSVFKKYAPNPVVNIARKIVSVISGIRSKLLELGDRYGLVSPDEIYTDNWYEQMASNEGLQRDAEIIVDALASHFSPGSVLDLGCGVGHYLNQFETRGIDAHGVDGAEGARNNAVVDKSTIEIYDLRETYEADREYDLVICFEVAEHLAERYADALVDSIVNSGPRVAFTAATPGQGGTHHVNEQPRSYWKKKFRERGWEYDSEAVSELREQMKVSEATWIPDNLFVFKEE